MADNFDDKNLFGDSFDLFKSDSGSLFGQNNMANKNNNKVNNVTNKAGTSANNTPKTDFGFDDNLFGGDLFGSSDSNKNLNSTKTNQSAIKSEQKSQTSTNLDFGFDDNNLFGETPLPHTQEKPTQNVPANLFDSSTDLFGDEKQEQAQVQEEIQEIEASEIEQGEVPTVENQELSDEENLQEEVSESENNSSKKTKNKSNKKQEKSAESPKDKGKGKKNKKSKNIEENAENIESLSESQEESENLQDIQEQDDQQIDETLVSDESDSQVKDNKKSKIKEFFGKHKKLIAIISSALFVVIAAIVLIVLLTNKPGEKLLTPNFNVYQRESGTVLVVDEQKNALGYEIVISQTGKPDAVFSSKDSTIELRLYLNEPGIFNVKVRVLSDSTATHSDFSISKQVTNYVKLDTPTLFKNGNIISWNNVANAVAYKLYYRANVQDGVVDFVEIPADKSEYAFDVTQLEQYGAGLYPICVEAIASGEFMLNSDYSETINFAYTAELDKPMAVVYDAQNQKLTFAIDKNKTQSTKYLVTVSLANGTVLANHYIFTNELEKQEITYQGIQAILYTANLSELLAGEPVSITIKALGDGIYTFDSEIVDALAI